MLVMKLPPQPTEKTTNNSELTLVQMEALLSKKEDIIDKKSDVIISLKQRVALLEEYLRLSKIKRFGASSEQTPPEQGNLFNEAEVVAEPEPEESPKVSSDKKAKTGRKPFSDKLPRVQVFAALSDEEKKDAIDTFFVKVREELDIIPAKVRVLEYMQEKAVFINEDNGRLIKAAEVIKHPIPKAMGSVNLMTYVIISKYADGLPLYRLENIIKRYGGELSRATLANWMIALAKQLQPLINLMRETQCEGTIIYADETRLQVLKEPDKPPTGDKYMWVTLGGLPEQQSVLFEYDPSRKRTVPLRLLEGFTQGYLQTDGYAGYNAVVKKNKLIQLGCWDHARRKFKEAQAAQPKNTKKASKADMALSYINKLYVIERQIKTLSHHERYQVRQEKSLPILEKLKTWLATHRPRVVKDGLTGKAMTYLHNQWNKLTVYCTDGQLRISNILAENAIRPFAVGRKAWLFADTPAGAHASSVHFSLIETAKLNEIEPYEYINTLLKALPYADTVEKLEALLPWNFKKNKLS